MKQEKIQAYLLRVNKLSGVVYKGYLAEVDNTLEAEQRYVNYDEPHGLITVLSITDEIDVIANDEGSQGVSIYGWLYMIGMVGQKWGVDL